MSSEPHDTPVETLISAMQELARSIKSADGIANAAIAEAAIQMDAMVRDIASLRHVAGVLLSACDKVEELRVLIAKRDRARLRLADAQREAAALGSSSTAAGRIA